MQLIKIHNPFQRHLAKVEHIDDGQTLSDIIETYLVELNAKAREVGSDHVFRYEEMEEYLRVTISGNIVPFPFWPSARPQKDDLVTVSPVMGKSETGKQILNIAAMIGAMYIGGPFLAKHLIGPLGFSAGVTFALGTALAVGATGYAISALTPKPDKPEEPNGIEPSPSYSWNPRVTQAQGPIAEWFGTVRVHPNISAVHTEVPDATWATAEDYDPQVMQHKMNILACFGRGPIQDIQDASLLVKNQPVANYPGISSGERKGYINQAVLPKFTKTKLEYFVNQEFGRNDDGDMEDGGNVIWTTPDNDFDELEIEIMLPNGHYMINSAGNIVTRLVWFEIEISVADAESWTTFVEVKKVNRVTGTARYTFKTATTYSGPNFIQSNTITIVKGNRYDIRCTRHLVPGESINTQQLYTRLGVVREEVQIAFTYPQLALLEVVALATDTLSGDFDISAIVEGRIVHVYDGSAWNLEWTDNPAWVIWFLLTRPVISGDGSSGDPYTIERYEGISPSNMDLAKFWELAQWADQLVDNGNGGTEKRITFNGGFEAATNPKKAADQVCRIARCQLYQNGSTWTLAIDKADTAEQMFQMSSIKKGSFSRVYLPPDEMVSEVEWSILDRARDYSRESGVIFNTSLTNRTKVLVLDLIGVTYESLAWRHGNYELNKIIYQKSVVAFDADIDSIGSTVGDVFKVAHSTPEWGISGLVISGTAISIVVAEDISYSDSSAADYELFHRHSDNKLNNLSIRSAYSGIRAVNTGSKQFTVYSDRVAEFIAGDIIRVVDSTGNDDDYTVVSAALSGSDTVITVSEAVPDGTGDGGLYNLHRITGRTPFLDSDGNPSAPVKGDIYGFGQTLIDIKTYRMIGIKRTSEQYATIRAIVYDSRVYDGDATTPVLPLGAYSLPAVAKTVPLEIVSPPITVQQQAATAPQNAMGSPTIDTTMLTNAVWTDTVFTNDEYLRYKLDDNLPDQQVRDNSVNEKDGIIAGGANNSEDISVAGKRSLAFDFDGTHYVDSQNTHEARFDSSFTVSLFIKPDDGQPGANEVLFGNKSGANNQILCYLETGTGKLVFVYTADGNSANSAKTNAAVFANGAVADYHHVAFVGDSTVGGVGGLKIYFDGSEVTLDGSDDGDTSGVTFADLDLTGRTMYIGSYNNEGTPSSKYNGAMDDFKIFERVLSDAEILDLANLADEEVTWAATDNDSANTTPILVTINGISYEVADGIGTKRFIYFDLADPEVFNETDDFDTATSSGRWVMGINDNGVVNESYGSPAIHCDMLKANTLQALFARLDRALIQTAHIRNLAVETLQVADNAITVPVSAYTSGSVNFTNTLTTVQSVAVATTGDPVQINFSCVVFNGVGGGFGVNQIRITRDDGSETTVYDDTTVKQVGFNDAMQLTFHFKDTPGTATTTYRVKLKTDYTLGNFQAQHRSLFAISVKK